MLGVVLLLALPLSFILGAGALLARWLLLPKVGHRRAVFVMAADPARSAAALPGPGKQAAAGEEQAGEAEEPAANGGLKPRQLEEGCPPELDSARKACGEPAGEAAVCAADQDAAGAELAEAAPLPRRGATAGRWARLARAARALCGARPYQGTWISLHLDSRFTAKYGVSQAVTNSCPEFRAVTQELCWGGSGLSGLP